MNRNQEYIQQLRKSLSESFNESELKTLCFDLAVDFEDLPGETKSDKVRELILYFEHRGSLTTLTNMLAQYRPEFNWKLLRAKSEHNVSKEGTAFRDRIKMAKVFLSIGRVNEGLDRLESLFNQQPDNAEILSVLSETIEDSRISFERRSQIANLVGTQRDARLGVCTVEPKWCVQFPANNYKVGYLRSTKKTVRLDSFCISKYLVTVWQFQQFYLSGGYEQKHWWTPEGWRWLQTDGFRYEWQDTGRISQPFLWEDPDFTTPNQPVVGVMWYDAVAYCNWITAQGHDKGWLGPDYCIRLPSEAEWEVAATWDQKANQTVEWSPPEGQFWQNVEELGIRKTTPVGLFPQGKSPCGALDMAGNLFEWCHSHYDTYPDQSNQLQLDFPPKELRSTVRGGSFMSKNKESGWHIRGPFVYMGCGFRLVLSEATK